MPIFKNTKQQKNEILKKVLRKAQTFVEQSERSTEKSEAESLVEPKNQNS